MAGIGKDTNHAWLIILDDCNSAAGGFPHGVSVSLLIYRIGSMTLLRSTALGETDVDLGRVTRNQPSPTRHEGSAVGGDNTRVTL